MEYQEHYEGMTERNLLCGLANGNGYRMLHDDFDEDWKRGDEPHGTLTFTDEIPAQAPKEPKIVFTATPPRRGYRRAP
ncbi:hypothetical protein ES708_24103 [subsurface metagenome]